MILTIPVRKTTIRRDGANVDVLEVAHGFCEVLHEDVAFNRLTGGPSLVSNPLQEWAVRNLTFLAGNDERIFLVLAELPSSNPGKDDNGPSLIHQQGV